jgi:hypothetical protein
VSRRDAARWVVASAALLVAPRLALAWSPGRLSLSPEAAVLIALVWLAGRWTARRWPAWVAAVLWTVILAFDTASAVGKYATSEELPLYDELLLAHHLYILGRDLFGGLATAGLVATIVAPLPVAVVGALLFGEIQRLSRALPARVGAGLAVATALVGVGYTFVPKERWSAPRLARNLDESWDLYWSVREQLNTRTHEDVRSIELHTKPDVVIYVIESYGRVVATDPTYVGPWTEEVQQLDREMRDAGWATASGYDTSPVRGGRSWIADQSLLLGLHVSHEAEYQHVVTWTDRLPSLRKWFDDRGYVTVIVKPTDRERPGVPLWDPYGFDRGVFAVDLDYHGPIVGWGQIPDQYSIERVQELVLNPIQEPRFAFFHLATSHLPWTPAPEIVDHWQDWQSKEGSREPLFVQRSIESQIDMELTRYKRKAAPSKASREVEGQHENYLADVLYDLRCIGRNLAGGPGDRPTLVVILGDHQPPVLAETSGYDVPVHLLASDPSLLAVFDDLGFDPGLVPVDKPASVAHEELFDVLAKSLARADHP